MEHPNDPNNPPHMHTGGPKGGAPAPDYPYRTERYGELNPNNLPDPHIYYDPPTPSD